MDFVVVMNTWRCFTYFFYIFSSRVMFHLKSSMSGQVSLTIYIHNINQISTGHAQICKNHRLLTNERVQATQTAEPLKRYCWPCWLINR